MRYGLAIKTSSAQLKMGFEKVLVDHKNWIQTVSCSSIVIFHGEKTQPGKGKTKTEKSLCITTAPQRQDRGKP